MNNFHTPVLLSEVIENLNIGKDKKYIDATLGGGGHTEQILKLGGEVLAIDVDQEAIDYVQEKVKNWERLTLARGNFRDIDKIAHSKNFGPPAGGVAGIIFDLGVSSHQLDTPVRGFSFQKEGPLDMRMDQDLRITAKDMIKILTKGELYELFNKLGEESNARFISKAIVSARKMKPIETTKDLVQALEGIPYKNPSKIHSATKIFQALRIAVNDELNSLKEALPKALELLDKNGRMMVISFHSLEDRIVKNMFLDFASKGIGEILTRKPILSSLEEIERNRRSRSAKLRIFVKN